MHLQTVSDILHIMLMHGMYGVWRYGAGVSSMNHPELICRSGTGIGMSGGQWTIWTVRLLVWSAVTACVMCRVIWTL